MTDQALAAGTEIAGYTLVRVVGQGGFGIVYEAVNPVTQARVAIKEFFPRQMVSRQGGTILLHSTREDEQFRAVLARFAETARLQFAFSHPHILKVLNYVAAGNTGFMITEYVDGISLEAYLAKTDGCFKDEADFRAEMEPLLGAVGYVHRKGHLHRDISPDNIMIRGPGDPVLIDFGSIKRSVALTDSEGSLIFVREAYSPREQQTRSEAESFCTDLYALGGTIYRCLTGAPPVSANVRADFVLNGKPDPYVPLAQATRVACSDRVYGAVDRSLRLVMDERPGSIEEFTEALGWTPDFGNTHVVSTETTLVVKPAITINQVQRKIAPPTQEPAPPPEPPAPPLPPPPPPPPAWKKWLPVAATAGVIAVLLLATSGSFGFNWSAIPARVQAWIWPNAPVAYCEQQQGLDAALKASDLFELQQYVAQCASFPNGQKARAQLLAREEDGQFQLASRCIEANPCGASGCLAAYQARFDRRLADLNGQVRRVAETCRPPAQAPAQAPASSSAAATPSQPVPTQAFCDQPDAYKEAVGAGPKALAYYVRQCSSNRFTDDAKGLLKNWEAAEYSAARQCIAADAACAFEGCIQRYTGHFADRLGELQSFLLQERNSARCQPRQDPCGQKADYERALGGGLAGLRDYVGRCPSGAFRSQADGEIRALEVRAREAAAYDSSISCLSRSCDVNGCIQPYRAQFTERAGTLAALAREVAESARCKPRQALPDGVYTGARGYNNPKGSECRANYVLDAIYVTGTKIEFASDKFVWSGTIDQRTGVLTIEKSGIRSPVTGNGPNRDLSVRGHFRNAALFSGECGAGFLRIDAR